MPDVRYGRLMGLSKGSPSSNNQLVGPHGLAHFRFMRRFFNAPVAVLDELCLTYGSVCRLGFGPLRVVIIGDPVVLRELFATSTDSFRWGNKFNVLGFVVGNESMIVSDGPNHSRRRSSVQNAFSRRRLNGWIPMIIERTDAAIERLTDTLTDQDQIVDLYPIGRMLVLEVAISALFGQRLAARTMEIGNLFERPQEYLESSFFKQLPHPFPFTARSRVRSDRRALDAIIDAEIAQRRSQPSGDPRDVLETLVQEGTLSDSEIRDQVVSLIGAGYNTTASSLAWMLWCAALTPGLWHRLRIEADTVFGSLDGSNGASQPIDDGLISRLELADRTMRETLRLHPAGVVSPREAAVDVHVGGYVIPKGTLIMWSAHLAGRNSVAWADPLRYNPDRFANLTNEQKSVVDQAWVPFGRGARNCIGFMLAQMELTIMIARLAQRLDIVPITDVVPQPVGLVVNRPLGGVPMRVNVRTNKLNK